MIPAACIPVPLTEPSKIIADSITLEGKPPEDFICLNCLTCSNSSELKFSRSAKLPSPVNEALNIRSKVILGLSGTNLAKAFDSDKGKSNTRATSFNDIFAAIVP